MSSGVAIVSGGLDSVTMVYDLLAKGYTDLHLLSFDYGQRHSKELMYADMTARQLNLRHDVINLTGITHLISNSALTSFDPSIDVPEGHYAEDNMKLTVVPNRNMIMLSIAAGVAVNEKATFVATGVHAGDHAIYSDCRPDFINAAELAMYKGNEGLIPTDFRIEAPFLHLSKADIAYRAITLKVPLHLTWSCYKGGERHCGRCGTCVERLEAIDHATKVYQKEYFTYGPIDRTDYEDTEYWKVATHG